MNPEIRRADDAERLLSEPLMKEAFDAVESTLIAHIKRVAVGDSDAQRDLIVSLQLLGKVRGYLQSVIDTGKMARLDEEKKSWVDRLRNRR
jgi:hypothetical protein